MGNQSPQMQNQTRINYTHLRQVMQEKNKKKHQARCRQKQDMSYEDNRIAGRGPAKHKKMYQDQSQVKDGDCCDDCGVQTMGSANIIDSDTSSDYEGGNPDETIAHMIMCTSPENCKDEITHAKLRGAQMNRSQTQGGSEYPTKLALAKKRAVMEPAGWTPSTQAEETKTVQNSGKLRIPSMAITTSSKPTAAYSLNPADGRQYESDCSCSQKGDFRSYHRLVSHDEAKSEYSGATSTSGRMSVSSTRQDNWSSLDSQMHRYASQMFEGTVVENYVARAERQRRRMRGQDDMESDLPSVEAPSLGAITNTPEPYAVNSLTPTDEEEQSQQPLGINMLCLSEEDFPDICTQCDECMRSIRDAIQAHTSKEIKDVDIAEAFVQTAMEEVLKALEQRSQQNHQHHVKSEHQPLEDNLRLQFSDTRRVMLGVQKEKRKFKFNQIEYKITRKVMVDKVSRLIHMRITDFMKRILSCMSSCNNKAHKHDDVSENSMLFKELNFGMKQWDVEIPTTGFVNMMPFFSYSTHKIKQPYDDLDKVPKPKEIEQFIVRIMTRMSLSNEVCLLSFIFIERLLKKGGVQLLTINWRPIVYSAMLTATKYWEDYYFWNADFVEVLKLYPVQATNRMESTFLALCNYELFVSETLYERYYIKIIGNRPPINFANFEYAS